MNKSYAPVCLFTYNRLNHTKETVSALQKNFLAKQTELFIFSDGPKTIDSLEQVNSVRVFLKNISGFRKVTILESKENIGLANSVINGVSKIINEYERVIVLEDDIVTLPNFLDFMNHSLDSFENKGFYSVNGFCPRIISSIKTDYLIHERSYPWGWGTWKDKWNKVNFNKVYIKDSIISNQIVLKQFSDKFGKDISKMLLDSIDGKNDSWYVRWLFNNFNLNYLSIFPNSSLVKNIGFNNPDSTHCGGLSAYLYTLDNSLKRNFDCKSIIQNKNINIQFLKYFTKRHKVIFRLRLLLKPNGFHLILNELIQTIQNVIKFN
jgi:hypothetical protein